jgi:hypothetical protein
MSNEWWKNLGQSDRNTGQGDRSKTAEGYNWGADQQNKYRNGYGTG